MADDENEALRKEVLKWMDSAGRGYKAAAKHFGLDRNQVRTWGRHHRNGGNKSAFGTKPRPEPMPPRARAREVPARLLFLRDQYADAVAALDRMVEAGSWQASVSARRHLVLLHQELDALEKAEADRTAEDLAPEEFEAELVETLRDLPRDMAQRLMDEAHPPPGLRVVSGGEG